MTRHGTLVCVLCKAKLRWFQRAGEGELLALRINFQIDSMPREAEHAALHPGRGVYLAVLTYERVIA